MKVVAFVPIKMNNERFPGKNTVKLTDGTPLCNLLFNTLTKVDEIDESYCFCSDDSICQYLPETITFLKRDKKLDSKQTTANDIIESFISMVDADIYVKAQVTSPFLSAQTIKDCINAVINNDSDSSTTVEDLHSFLWNKTGPVNYDLSKVARTQDLEPLMRETTGVYVFRKDLFIKEHRCLGKHPYLKAINAIEALDLDYPEDFEIINAVYSHRISISKQ